MPLERLTNSALCKHVLQWVISLKTIFFIPVIEDKSGRLKCIMYLFVSTNPLSLSLVAFIVPIFIILVRIVFFHQFMGEFDLEKLIKVNFPKLIVWSFHFDFITEKKI